MQMSGHHFSKPSMNHMRSLSMIKRKRRAACLTTALWERERKEGILDVSDLCWQFLFWHKKWVIKAATNEYVETRSVGCIALTLFFITEEFEDHVRVELIKYARATVHFTRLAPRSWPWPIAYVRSEGIRSHLPLFFQPLMAWLHLIFTVHVNDNLP